MLFCQPQLRGFRAMMPWMLESVARFFRRHRLGRGDRPLLVGVSGGPDSVALLDALCQIGGVQLHVCHMNHRLRGAASDGDERFVRALSRKYRLPLHAAREDVRARAKAQKLSLEEAARAARLRFFARVARKLGARGVVLAHHADDQAETFLLRLLRGAGARGLGAMRPRARIGRLTIFRPLLGVTRAEILKYLRFRRLKYRTDASNRDVSILRNRVRHRLLPLLEREFNPAIREVLRREAEILQEEDRFLERLAARARGKRLPLALRRRVARMHSPRATFQQVEHLRKPKPTIATKKFHGYTVEARVLAKPEDFSPRARIRNEKSRIEYFDADRVGRWSIRFWRAGDRMRPLGMRGEKKLQDIFTDAKIPAAARGGIPLVIAGNGRIAWVTGVGMSEEFKVTAGTRRLLRLVARRV